MFAIRRLALVWLVMLLALVAIGAWWVFQDGENPGPRGSILVLEHQYAWSAQAAVTPRHLVRRF